MADRWRERIRTLIGEVCTERCESSKSYREVWLNVQKSVQAVVPKKLVKASRGKGLTVNAGKRDYEEKKIPRQLPARGCLSEDRLEAESKG